MWIWGNGGHAKVVRRAYQLPIDFLVDDADPEHPWKEEYRGFVGIIAIGSNLTRKRIAERLGEAKYRGVVDHSASIRCDYGQIHDGGIFIAAGAVAQVSVAIGKHAIINTCASVDHDCKIGDFAHIAPGAHLCGNVTVGEGTLIGAGTIVTPGVTIGPWLVIPAGSVVTKDCLNENDVATLRRR